MGPVVADLSHLNSWVSVLVVSCIAVQYKRTDRDLRPEQISALVLEKLKQAAEKTFDASIEGAVITVPAYFTDSQRQATKTAGIVAGLKVDSTSF